jgi:hypothetical protein
MSVGKFRGWKRSASASASGKTSDAKGLPSLSPKDQKDSENCIYPNERIAPVF